MSEFWHFISQSPLSFGNPIFDALIIAVVLAVLVAFRNALVSADITHVSHIFVGSDLVLSLYGLGLLVLFGIFNGHLTAHGHPIVDPLKEVVLVFLISAPLLLAAILTERAAHTRALTKVLNLWLINITTGTLPLVVAAAFLAYLFK